MQPSEIYFFSQGNAEGASIVSGNGKLRSEERKLARQRQMQAKRAAKLRNNIAAKKTVI